MYLSCFCFGLLFFCQLVFRGEGIRTSFEHVWACVVRSLDVIVVYDILYLHSCEIVQRNSCIRIMPVLLAKVLGMFWDHNRETDALLCEL